MANIKRHGGVFHFSKKQPFRANFSICLAYFWSEGGFSLANWTTEAEVRKLNACHRWFGLAKIKRIR